MKSLAMVIAAVLALPVAARADMLNPPGGPVYVEARSPQGTVDRGPQRAERRALKQALIARFDSNGDGRLGPRERMRAIRALRRIERRLATGGQLQGRAGANGKLRRRIIERFDTNGDGNVDRSELPPGAARALRRFDRDRDGWLDRDELR